MTDRDLWELIERLKRDNLLIIKAIAAIEGAIASKERSRALQSPTPDQRSSLGTE